MLHRRDVICIAGIEWDSNWQSAQEITSRLAKVGNRVLYVENTGIRSPGLSEAKRVARRFWNWAGALRTKGVRSVAPNLYVYSPLVLPPFGPRWRRHLNARLFLPQVIRAARRLGMNDLLILSYLPTDTAVDLIKMLRTPTSVVAYYRIDNLALLTPHTKELQSSEKTIIELSDLVLANSPELAELPMALKANVYVFPPSVNLDAFPLSTAVPSTMPDEAMTTNSVRRKAPGRKVGWQSIRRIEHPIIGYIGAITKHIDYGLVTEMARARPNWSWVFVGPVHDRINELSTLSNVQFFGQQPHDKLINFIREFDVCIIPYKINAYTDTVVPTKLNEYLAAGKPVVSTNLPAVSKLNLEHNILLTAEEQPESFLQAIETALRLPTDPAIVARRRAVAALGDWQTRIKVMSQLIEPIFHTKNCSVDSTSLGL